MNILQKCTPLLGDDGIDRLVHRVLGGGRMWLEDRCCGYRVECGELFPLID
jgi:hypothetical protein